MRELLRRHPWWSAVVVWFALFIITQGVMPAVKDYRERPWLAFVLLGLVVYAVFAVWITARNMKKFGRSGTEILFAVSAGPTIYATGLAFEGAPTWSLWVTLFVSGGLLIMSLRLIGQASGLSERPSSPNRISARGKFLPHCAQV